jgi:hypothetical protein
MPQTTVRTLKRANTEPGKHRTRRNGLLGQNRLAVVEQHFMADAGREYVVNFL